MKDFSNLNNLPAEIKLLVVNGQTLVDTVKEALKKREYRFDLTSKAQLKLDCRLVEKYIRFTVRGKLKDKHIKDFELSIVRLQTTYDGVVQFYTRG